MTSIGENQEERIMSAVFGLVCGRVQARLPADKRGIRAIEPIRARVVGTVTAALDAAVEEILAEVVEEVESAEPFAPEEGS